MYSHKTAARKLVTCVCDLNFADFGLAVRPAEFLDGADFGDYAAAVLADFQNVDPRLSIITR
jgi:hypothetical protein